MRSRPPAVAGSFYPADPEVLTRTVDRLLAEAGSEAGKRPKALIVPHAGYLYSGPIAASAYARLRGAGIRRVVLLGPSHFARLRGLALPEADVLETPLGPIKVDADAVSVSRPLEPVTEAAEPHAREHSLEVQLPFLQRVLGEFTLIPFAVGQAKPAEVAQVLEALWGGPETLILISSDLSHYLPYDEARATDRQTADRILALGPLEPDRACGASPVNGFLAVAQKKELQPELIDLRNSGDTAGPRDGVVGYGAFAFHEGPDGR